jgi:hypothetical protein
MLIVNTPICSHCGKCVMTRRFSAGDCIGMALFAFLFFPVAIWVYLNPRYLHCQGCGFNLAEQPA